MIFFTSDNHFGETRIGRGFNPFFRPFNSVRQQNEFMITRINACVSRHDELYHLGDVAFNIEGLSCLSEIRCKNLTLIKGNYDVDDPHKMPILERHFKEIAESMFLDAGGLQLHLNHYPINAVKDRFNLVGHIHGLWKVQPNMLNVGVDAWHFDPVSIEKVAFTKDAIENHYDKNVFPCS